MDSFELFMEENPLWGFFLHEEWLNDRFYDWLKSKVEEHIENKNEQ